MRLIEKSPSFFAWALAQQAKNGVADTELATRLSKLLSIPLQDMQQFLIRQSMLGMSRYRDGSAWATVQQDQWKYDFPLDPEQFATTRFIGYRGPDVNPAMAVGRQPAGMDAALLVADHISGFIYSHWFAKQQGSGIALCPQLDPDIAQASADLVRGRKVLLIASSEKVDIRHWKTLAPQHLAIIPARKLQEKFLAKSLTIFAKEIVRVF